MGILSLVRGSGAAWIAALTATTFLSGCFSHQAPHHDGPPAAGPSAAPDGTALSGSYDDGAREGEAAAEGEVVAHYFVLGAVTAPLIVLCIIGLANSKGGGGGGCGSGGTVAAGGATVAPRYLPPNASYRSPEFNDGYNQAYESRLNQRQGTAFGFGFLTGAVISAVGIGIYLSQENNRDNVEDEAGQHMTAGGRPRRGFSF
jgi:hypothetical protein